jgi:large subunit ribosomal protein L10
MAADRRGRAELSQIVEGPTALIFGFSEPNQPASAITEYIRSSRTSLTVGGAYFDGQVLPASDVTDLATLPSRPQLVSLFMGAMQSPLAVFSGLIAATLRDFAGLVEARSSQLEAAG